MYKLLKEMMGQEFSFDAGSQEPNPAANIFTNTTHDQPDIISMDVPTLIRFMEWAHEDCKDDVELHQVVNKIIVASFKHNPVTMDQYTEIISSNGGSPTNYEQEPALPNRSEFMFNN